MTNPDRIRRCLEAIYGVDSAARLLHRVEALCAAYAGRLPRLPKQRLTESDVVLITYPDQVQAEGVAPLACLREFLDGRVGDLVTAIHLLPFFPSSSDDGFAVMDYRAVDPVYGTWEEIRQLGQRYRLMYDAVINHVSAESTWFRSFLQGDPKYADYFIRVEESPDLSAVIRPRAQPLLTHKAGLPPNARVWTTFGEDQIDLNYKNPEVLLAVLDSLLYYVTRGASILRLDAVAYLWKELGTPCIHLPQTHWTVRLVRAVLDEFAPHVAVLTETNVPHADNVTYFGDGANEAHLVYNFALPGLVLQGFRTGRAATLAAWAGKLTRPSGDAAYFNILASHDGIALNPLSEILSDDEIANLTQAVEDSGGLVSRKHNADGSSSPYEVNANYFDALEGSGRQVETSLKVRRFVTAHAILLAFRGLPGIYFHSLIGSRGWPEGVRHSGRNRSINREKLDRKKLELELSDQSSLRAQIFGGIARLIVVRRSMPVFSPMAGQRVLEGNPSLLALIRGEAQSQVLCLSNMSSEQQSFQCDLWDGQYAPRGSALDLISSRRVDWPRGGGLTLAPYEALWLTGGPTKA